MRTGILIADKRQGHSEICGMGRGKRAVRA
jgi:hypothetical protein